MYKSQSITVIIPCLNEEQGIERVLRAMPEFVDETIVVDNASTDRTSEVAISLGAKVIREDVRGYGRAYKRGFAAATSDLIVTLDGDQSYPVDALSYLIEAFLHLRVDFLSASRFPVRDRQAMSFRNKIGNLALSLAMSVLFFRWVRDSQSGMWVFRSASICWLIPPIVYPCLRSVAAAGSTTANVPQSGCDFRCLRALFSPGRKFRNCRKGLCNCAACKSIRCNGLQRKSPCSTETVQLCLSPIRF